MVWRSVCMVHLDMTVRKGSTAFSRCVLVALILAAAMFSPLSAFARWLPLPPALPAPTGNVVNVNTEAGLQAAITNLTSGTTIVIAPGTYLLTKTLIIRGPLADVTVRGATNSRRRHPAGAGDDESESRRRGVRVLGRRRSAAPTDCEPDGARLLHASDHHERGAAVAASLQHSPDQRRRAAAEDQSVS